MAHLLLLFAVLKSILTEAVSEINVKNNALNDISNGTECNIVCPKTDDKMACAFDAEARKYTLFSSKCAMMAYAKCHKIGYIESALSFCIKDQVKQSRRFYGDSCPVFCPSHYRPVCAASKIRSYKYRTFNNGCYLDLINCRGDEDNGFVEVGLEFCQRHLMKNIFKEKVIISRFDDYRDYQDY